MGWNFGSATCYLDGLGFPRLVSSWCNQKDGTCPRVVPRMTWNSLGESTELCSLGHRRLNQCGVLSPSPGPPRAAGAGCPSAAAAAPGGEEHELESHTHLVPLLSDCVTLGKVFNCPSLGFLLGKVGTGSFLPRAAVAKEHRKRQVWGTSLGARPVDRALVHGVKSDGFESVVLTSGCIRPGAPSSCRGSNTCSSGGRRVLL